MSQHQSEIISCPYCKESTEVEIWSVIDTSTDPDMVESVITGDLFRVVCPHCGKEFKVSFYMTYLAMDRQFIVYYNPLLREKRRANRVIRMYEENDLQEYKYRFVFDPESLCEKARLIDARLDDRVVEAMKIILVKAIEETNPYKVTSMVFDISVDDEYQFVMMVDDDKRGILPFDVNMYRMCQSNLFSLLIIDKSPVVDKEWAITNVLPFVK